MRITVLSTFDVWPPRDGGQTRYVNLWRNFSREHEITILAYDFLNPTSERRYRLDRHVEVVVPPAAKSDVRHFHHCMERTGLWLHDALCLTQYGFSDAFLAVLRREVERSDVLVAAHPYLATLAFPLAPRRTTRVYESYNVEYDIKRRYFESGQDRPFLARLLADVQLGERHAVQVADQVTAVSEDDRVRLAELYDVPLRKIRVVPNGANIRAHDLLDQDDRARMRQMLGVGDRQLGIFLGSAYPANVESYRRSREMLREAGFAGTMLLVGSIDQADRTDWPPVPFEELWFGFVTDELRDVLLGTADFALHLIFTGAGTNLKLFDYMGAGVPIIANAFGRRGVADDSWCWEAETVSELTMALSRVRHMPRDAKARIGRAIALEHFDWHAIASNFERDLRCWQMTALAEQPQAA